MNFNNILNHLEDISYVATIASSFIVTITLFFTAYSIKKSCDEFSANQKRECFSKAIEIAKEYAEIIADISYIQAVIRQDESMVSILNKLPLHKLNEFSESELVSLFENKEELQYLVSFYRNGNVNEEILIANYSLKNKGAPVNNTTSVHQAQSSALIKQDFYSTITGVLNKLEYISMSLNLNVSDEETLFPSLHQSFLTTVKVLYVKIALANKNYSDKFYTNIIQLFLEWRDRDMKNKDAEKELEQRNSELEQQQKQSIEAKLKENQMAVKAQINKSPAPLKK